MTVLTVTLTRAHKIAERIGAAMKAAQTVASGAEGVTVRMQARPTVDQVSLISDNTAKAVAAISHFIELARVQEAIRKAIARANVEGGISDMLATIETNKRIIAMYEAARTSHAVSADKVHVSAVEGYVWLIQQSPYASGVEVTGMDRKTVDDLEIVQKELERQNFALNDKLADLNAKQISLNVPDALRGELGL